MKPIKILQITNRIPWPLNDGGNIATWNVSAQLLEFGHDVSLASLNTRKHYFNPEQVPFPGNVYDVKMDTTVRYWGAMKGMFDSFPYNVKRFDSPQFHKLLSNLLREKNFDLIQLEGIYLGIYLETIRKFTNVPVVLRAHNIEYQIWERLSKGEPSFFRKIFLENLAPKIKAFEDRLIPLFDGIVAITKQDEEYFKSHGAKKMLECLPAGVDCKIFRAKENMQSSKSVSFIGSMEWMPNIEGVNWFLKKVWKEVLKEYPDSQFHLAGKKATKESIADNVNLVLHGQVPSAVDFLNKSKIFIVPLLSGGGMRLKILEAMAMGCCVVSTKIGAEGIEAKNGKHLLLVESEKDFSNLLIDLIGNESKLKTIGENARKLVEEKYDWKMIVHGFEKFYEKLI